MDTMNSTTILNAVTAAPIAARPSAAVMQAAALEKAYQQYRVLQVVYALSYATMFALTTTLIVYLRRNRSTAYKGDSTATRKVILPSFEPLFWVIAVLTGLYTLYFIFAILFDYISPVMSPVFGEVLVQGRQFMLYLVVAFLLQRSVSRPALVRAILVAVGLATIPIATAKIILDTHTTGTTQFIIVAIYRTLLMVGFVCLAVRPLSRASVRAQRELSFFALVYFGLVYIYNTLFYKNDYVNAMNVVFCTVTWASLGPFFIWRLLKADTEHWRGLSDRACEFQQLFRENQGMQEIVSDQGLHVLLEMHRKDIIDFAHLELARQIAAGASANVYRGYLRSSTEVAVKAYSPTEISEATILAFSQEAALCAALKHPNIVQFHGLCICPPSICLVYELCRGSLEDALITQSSRDYAEPLWPQLCYMLDAARAVAYLHSFSPPFIHRDIKPANYLLSTSNVIKLTDFGESRSMAVKMTDAALAEERKMSVRGTVDYMAPEMIDCKQGQAVYNEMADIFSLAITLWDILHPGREKYPTSKGNHLNIYRMVLDGQRPPIDPEVPQTLHDLLENAWNADPDFRPTAKTIVSTLEEMQQDLCGQIAHLLSGTVVYSTIRPSKLKGGKGGKATTTTTTTFTGENLAQCLFQHKYAFEDEEALRFGNALMDAGCLHHTKHAVPFEISATTQYTFDSYQLDLHEPCDEAGDSTFGDGSGYTGTTMWGDGGNGTCACRKLGQGHGKPAMKRKNLFRHRKHDKHDVAVNLLTDNTNDMDYTAFDTAKSNMHMLSLHTP
ncbi:Aste57867_16476 [Aphanomyces stellatus]|uniref:Aste57867_16476 protein n=1 Tax=Aphanomyces stellatus TaxID=120398 RepID=A0A485L5J4_9STRA|nr:hypothetical protein As57867_016419 [Aphanomyces stellatus]VFT93250.1 Aste57867_16476 [Aphanomyces stellatus]